MGGGVLSLSASRHGQPSLDFLLRAGGRGSSQMKGCSQRRMGLTRQRMGTVPRGAERSRVGRGAA